MARMIGILLLVSGGFSAASFYVPSFKIKKWSWETYWISLGFVAWMIMPTVAGLITTPDLWGILHASPAGSMAWAYVCGAVWGFGGLMCGMALRFLGLSLGQSISLGVCSIIGTLVPAAIEKKLYLLYTTTPGVIVLLGFLVCLVGIALCGYAGVLKEKQIGNSEKEKEKEQESIQEYAFLKGLLVAIFGGIMSASMAFAFTWGVPMAEAAVKAGTIDVFKNMPLLVLALAGGFTTNFISTMIIAARKRGFGDYIVRPLSTLYLNYSLAVVSGILWYGQWFTFGMGKTKMGDYSYAGWSIFMAAIIIFSNLWGMFLREWKQVHRRTIVYLWLGILVLTISVIMIGVGDGVARHG